MPSGRHTIIRWVSLPAALFILLQIVFIFAQGEAFCFNQGCRIVEKLTTVPPLYINLAGLLYFLTLFSLSAGSGTRMRTSIDRPIDLIRLLLLLGLAVEGVLLSYQLFVIQTFCAYCLVILGIIAGLNIICGWQQIRVGAPLFGAILITFGVLNFSPASLLALQGQTLGSGTYAVKKCEEPLRKLYFFFSADCPHCKKVLSILENCNSCEFHFNPIDRNQTLAIAGLEFNPSYSAALNRVILSMLDIRTIPVLLARNQDGMTFIKGEEAISSFISQTCFRQEPEIAPAPILPDDQEGMNFLAPQEGECTIEVECPDEAESLQSPFMQ